MDLVGSSWRGGCFDVTTPFECLLVLLVNLEALLTAACCLYTVPGTSCLGSWRVRILSTITRGTYRPAVDKENPRTFLESGQVTLTHGPPPKTILVFLPF